MPRTKPSTTTKPRKRATPSKAAAKVVSKKPTLKKVDSKKAKRATQQTSAQSKTTQKRVNKYKATSKSITPLNLSARTLWPKTSELVSLEFALRPQIDCELYSRYTIGLHAWFLQQIQSFDTELSAYMHDSQSEKAFSLSGLSGQFVSHRQSLRLQAKTTYRWRVNALSKRVAQGLLTWLRQLPDELELKNAPLTIESVSLAQPATTYSKLLKVAKEKTESAESNSVSLSFVSPTSFRRKDHHLPLPWPRNVFHSYLRRWNHFARKTVDPTDFLDWIDEYVVIEQHYMSSVKVAAGKQGSVTGFTGSVTYGLSRKATENLEYRTLFYALASLAPFCGTGHKTTFGLGETHLGWQDQQSATAVPTLQQILAKRIEELTALFLSQKKRQGGTRATDTAQKWATILARREQGDGLKAIAQDMNIPYETVKTYSKLARRALRESE